MKRFHRLLFILLFAGLVVGASIALSRAGGGYDLFWHTIDGGGHTFSSGGDYTLGGTVGQPDAGAVSGGDYTLYGGFWPGAATGCRIYLPLVMRNM